MASGITEDILAACHLGDTSRVETILKNNPDIIDKPYSAGFTALHTAARAGQKDVVELLISKGADVNIQTKFHATPVQIAAGMGHKDVVELLVSKGAKIDIFIASALGDIGQVKKFLANDPNSVNAVKANFTPLHWAAYCGRSDVIELLMANGANINAVAGHATALYWAVRKNQLPAAKLLIEKGATVNAKESYGSQLLLLSTHLGLTDMVKLLINNGMDVNTTYGGRNAIHIAARNDDLEITKLLISKGADVNAKDRNGSTAFDLAQKENYSDIINLLRKGKVE